MAEQKETILRAAINALVPKISQHRYRQITEEETKQWLIAPLLGALGWDTHDPDEVRYEYKANRQCNPVDYGLMVEAKTKLVIEAKGLGRDLDTGIAQLFGNLGVAGGVDWGVLTDGNQYRVYKVTGDGGVSEKLFFEICISDDAEAASRMLGLLSKSSMANTPAIIDVEWRDRLLSNHVGAALREMLDGTDTAIIDNIRRRHPEHSPGAVAAYLARLDVKNRGGDANPPSMPPDDNASTDSVAVDSVRAAKRPKKGYDLFEELVREPIKQETLIAEMVKAGFSVATVKSYIQWSKRPITEDWISVLLFQIEATTDKDGGVWLHKKAGRDFRHQDLSVPFNEWIGR